MAKIKYVRLRDNTYFYQRDYPLKLQRITGKKTYSRSLGLKSSSTEIAIQKAALKATEMFSLHIKSLENSSLDDFETREADLLARDILAKIRKKIGVYADATFSNDLALSQKRFLHLNEDSPENHFTPEDLAESALEELGWSDVVEKERSIRNKELSETNWTINDEALVRAYQLLIIKTDSKPRPTLSQLWNEYTSFRGIDLNSRNGKKAVKYWAQFMSIMGDQFATSELNKALIQAIQKYADVRSSKVSSSTIQRELSDIMSALKHGSKRHQLMWSITRPVIKETGKIKKKPLTPSEQTLLINYIKENISISPSINYDTPHSNVRLKGHLEGVTATLILLYLQGGMMSSEVKRLLPDDISFGSQTPYLVIRNETKTNARKRIVPIVVGLEIIKPYLPLAIEWLNIVTESSPSDAIKKLLRKITKNNILTGHCLRHTFKANAFDAGANTMVISAIAGWSEAQRSMSEHLLDYGSEALSSNKTVKMLFEQNKLINKHLIDAFDDSYAHKNELP